MSYSRIHSFKIASIAIFLCCSLAASAQVLRGNVTDGTSKKPAGGDDVILIKLDKGMVEEARTKANARGEFSFELPDSQTMRAIRVVHDKVSYFQPVMPGSTAVTVTVYESSAAVQGIRRTNHTVILQANDKTMQVFELFDVQNDSQPPHTQPTFTFYLPEGAVIQGGEAMREGGMPLKSAPVPQEEKGKYLFSYPVLPGSTRFQIGYSLPYTGSLKFQPKFAGPEEKFFVVTPKSIGFNPDSASQYQAATDSPIGSGFKNFEVHVASPTGQESQLGFNVSGQGQLEEDAAAQSASAQGGQAGPSSPESDERPGGGMGVPNERPNPLSQGQWGFLGVLTVFLAGGAAFIFIQSPSGPAVAAAPRAAHSLLDALKEEMFQLEADRLQGKINQQEYQGAKAALDKTLQRAMKKK